MRRRRPPVRENPLTPMHGASPDLRCRHSRCRVSGQTKRTPPPQRETASAGVYMGFGGGAPVPDSGPSAGAPPVSRPAPRRRLPRAGSRARRVGAASGGRPRFRGSAAGRPTPRSSPGCTTPRRERSAACGPCAVPPNGRWPGCWLGTAASKTPNNRAISDCVSHTSPPAVRRTVTRSPSIAIDPRENALHRRRHYRSAGRAFISRRMVWSSTLA